MVNAIVMSVVLLMMFALPVQSLAAETVKVRYLASVYADSKDGAFNVPHGVACTGKSVIVADTENDRLVLFALEQGVVTGGDEWKIPELTGPVRAQINSKGEVLVLDGRKLRIVKLSPEGSFKGYFDAVGLPPGPGVVPRNLKVDSSDNVYVLDIFGGRVLVLNAGGNFQKQIPFPEGYAFISDVAVDSRGVVYLLDSVKAMIYSAPKDAQTFTPFTKGLEEHVKFPTDMAVDGGGTIFVVDHNGGIIAMLGQNGAFLGHAAAFGWKGGQLRYPSQICVNDKGNLFIADRSNNRIQMFEVIK